MFFADWNDCLNLGGVKNKAESVMVAQMFVAAAMELSRLAKVSGRSKDEAKYVGIAEGMKEAINKYAWDGSWYLRGFTDDEEPVGSSKCKEGKIFLETQPWAVISGSADAERAKKCMKAVVHQAFGDILSRHAS